MKKVISYPFLVGLCGFLFSCESEPKSKEAKIVEDAAKEVKVVEDVSSSFGSRYDHDIVNDLYKQLLKEDKELTELEVTTNELLEKENDVEDVFKHYNSRSTDYYLSAQNHINSISDSLLKQKYTDLILKSQTNYKFKIRDLEKIINSNDLKVLQIEDLRHILKLTTTLAFLEKYQDKAKPDKKPFNDVNKELNAKAAEIQKKIVR